MPNQSPFDIMQNPLVNAYAKAALKDRFEQMEETRKQKKQSENLEKFKSFAKSRGKELKYKMTDSGIGAEEIEEKPVTMQNLQVGAAGALSPSKYAQIGRNMNVPRETLPPEETPGAAMSLATGGVGDVSGAPIAPVEQDYGQTVMNALRKNPLITNRGRADRTPLPSTFAEDFKIAHDSAAGDPDKFVQNLKDMSVNYYDDPKALAQIKRLIDLNKPKKSGRPTRK